jgi:hypothetical protein
MPRYLVYAMVLAMLLGTACVSLQGGEDISALRLRWLQGIPCRAPCWEGVTPGETDAADALVIWRRNTALTGVERGIDLSSSTGQIWWKWASDRKGGSAAFDKRSPAERIMEIALSYPWSYNLGEVISAYGEPTHIAAYAACYPDRRGASYVLFVVFKRNSFALSSEMKLDPETGRLMLDNETTFDYVRFYAADRDIRVPQVYGYGGDPSLLVPWRGPQLLSSYLRDYTGGRCFVPTPTPQ